MGLHPHANVKLEIAAIKVLLNELMWYTLTSPSEKEIVIEHPNRRIPFLRNEDLGSSTHITRISMMTSEESPPKTDPKRDRKSSSLPSLPSFSSSLHSAGSDSERESVWQKIKKFFETHERVVSSFAFLLFLPIALPIVLFRAALYDCMKVRQIFVLTLECMIMQLQLVFEMMSCIQHSNASIDEKVEKMGRAFHFLNMFNPVHWMGMLLYYADHKNHHTSPAKTSLVDQGNQTSGCDHGTPRRKLRSKGEKSEMGATKNVHLTFADEKYPLSEPSEEEDHITPANREYDPCSSPGNTSTTSTLTNTNEKDAEFQSTVNSPATDGSGAEVDESY